MKTGRKMIKNLAMGAWVGCFLLGTIASAQAQDEASWRRSEQIGAQLHELDQVVQAAYKAGEELRAFRRDDKILDWVSERSGGDYRITFVGEARDGTPIALYQVEVSASGAVLDQMRRIDKSPLQDRLAAQYEAGKNAAAVERESCSNDNQSFVLPNVAGGQQGWSVYLLPRSSYDDVIMFGGSYRMDMSAYGDTVQAFSALAADGCSVLSNPVDAEALQQNGAQRSGPNELHVYLSLKAGKPLYVISEDHTWLIQNGRIRLMPSGVPGA